MFIYLYVLRTYTLSLSLSLSLARSLARTRFRVGGLFASRSTVRNAGSRLIRASVDGRARLNPIQGFTGCLRAVAPYGTTGFGRNPVP